jgi:hypothetical protein
MPFQNKLANRVHGDVMFLVSNHKHVIQDKEILRPCVHFSLHPHHNTTITYLQLAKKGKHFSLQNAKS